jgi:hypothetical protein
MPRLRKGQHSYRPYRPTHSIRFRILAFLFDYRIRVARGQPWPVAFFIRSNLFSPPQNWTAELRGTAREAGLPGAPPRPDRFQTELDACCEAGWIDRIIDEASKRTRYRITPKGEEEYQKWVVHFLNYEDSVVKFSPRDRDKGQ